MDFKKPIIAALLAVCVGLAGCNREQSDWEKTRAANTAPAYQLFVKKYPHGAFTAQAGAQLQELEGQRDWQKARDADTAQAYQAFLTAHPHGKWSEEARIRIENFALAQPPAAAAAGAAGTAATPGAGADTGAGAGTGAGTSVSEEAPASSAEAAAPVARASARHTHATKVAIAGAYGVQLGAFKSGAAAANRHWKMLAKKYASLLHGLSPSVHATKTGAGHVYRLQVAGLSAARARAVCQRLKAKGQACIVLRPAHKHRRAHVGH